MAEILSSQYKSVFTKPFNQINNPPTNMQDTLEDIDFTEEDITTAIRSIQRTSSPGPDCITAGFLKDYKTQLAKPLFALWRLSLDNATTPDGVNLAYITPIFKSDDKHEPANYRPIALTNHTTKIFEKIIKSAIVNHLCIKQLFNESQHGFRKSRSTLTNLIEYYESILHLLEHERSVDSIYLDFSKAFDKCDHNIILSKLHHIGIRGKIHSWISDFLKNRQQCVVIEGQRSKVERTTSGVPQGSVLGPLLFLILMYDITHGINEAIISSFADDTKLWRGITGINEEVLLQNSANTIYTWATQNNAEFNTKKFQAISFSKILSECQYTDPLGNVIAYCSLVKDLGIHMSQDLSFDQHIRVVVNKGKHMAGWILLTFKSRERVVLITMLKQLIYPTIEYCCILWMPKSKAMITLLENVQKNFTKKIDVTNDLNDKPDYWERLQTFCIYSLQRRRERYAILYTWKIIHNIYPNPGLQINYTWPNMHTDNHNLGINIQYGIRTGVTVHHYTDNKTPMWIKKHSVLETCCNLYNALPSNLRQLIQDNDEPSPTQFKCNLDKWLKRIPDQPTSTKRIRAAESNSIIHQKAYLHPR